VVNFTATNQNAADDYFGSLADQYFDYMKPKEDLLELERDNEINFI
jgi:hypothetical protein